MKPNNITYPNLRAEMGRKNLGIGDMAKVTGINRDTLSRKLSKKSPIYLDEAFLIQRTVFPTLDVKYLFDHDPQKPPTPEQAS